MATQFTMVPAAAGDESKWNFLDDTYWIVPTVYLPAFVLANVGGTPHLVPAVDQTVWHIQAVVAGYVFGEVETNIGGGWIHSTLVGSISTTGNVNFSFTPDDPRDALTIGGGSMQQMNGDWFFEMQMTSGSSALSVTHWAYMAKVTPDDAAWSALPGYANTTVPAVFDNDPSNDGAATLKIAVGTDAGEHQVAFRNSGTLMLGEGGDDTMLGNIQFGDALIGGDGNDRLFGRGGDDELYGQTGADKLVGGDGNDMLDGGAGADGLNGGAGADRFVFANGSDSTKAARDTIVDFSEADHDKIDLSLIDAKPSTDGNNDFHFIGQGAFTHTEGEVRYQVKNGNTFVDADANGDGVADLSVRLLGDHALTAASFIL